MVRNFGSWVQFVHHRGISLPDMVGLQNVGVLELQWKVDSVSEVAPLKMDIRS